MLATLEDGIRTILSARHRHVPRRRLKADVDWLTDDDSRHAFGFISLCDFLGIDAQYLWARVLAAHSMGPYAATFPVRINPRTGAARRCPERWRPHVTEVRGACAHSGVSPPG
jgi:hypothetical protein